jgi:hypothetical protein
MHFGFIDSLKKGWNHIYKRWLEKIEAAFEECRELINQADLL